ncbi:2-hydroxyacid dehydrogenase [Paracoccus albus]|uniref:2-hydroxyacid dehydrogenase n=1 Tax=Paracoccus albus TaxID=3017784 RepID=UPI0022F13CAE|nr:2-hydroxyacid dehydrogenase [Paracoccus albus]WBU60996.1 2-hydroxyacid dehydrogenase [Paracoccus albus]
MTRVVFLDPTTSQRLDLMRSHLPEGWRLDNATARDSDTQMAAIEGADFAIASDVAVTGAMMATPGLKGIHKWGVGYDGIDLEAARKHGVRVMRLTGSNAIAVAETTLALILSVNRNIVRGHVGIHNGDWLKAQLAPTATTLSGQTVGIVGMGYVGKALARLLKGFGCRVLYSKRTPLSAEEEAETGASHALLDDMLVAADVVTLNCELNDSTRNLIDRDKLALMKPDAILVNAARGGVLVEQDLADAIQQGKLRGAGVDVFSIEPIQPDNPLMNLDRVILTPHVAAGSSAGFARSIQRMMDNMLAVHEGRMPNEIDILV